MIKLYDFPLSGHGHRARLMLSLLDLEYENITVDLTKGEQREDSFKALNPFGQVPVLVDGDLVIRDSAAIITYLARKYGPEWYPADSISTAHIQQWLATATKDIVTGPGAARLVTVFGAALDHEALIKQSHALLTKIEAHLVDRQWLALDRPTVADVAAYAYIAHAPEGRVTLQAYPNVRRWLRNVEQLPNFIHMPKTDVDAAA
jgi:glutathione S-transferase